MLSISVITPTYNRAHLLPRAMQSLLDQTLPDFELIVVDDGSTDNTRQVVERFGDPRIRYVYQANEGAAEARNRGAACADGRYITFLDSDDEALPTWLERFVQAFRQNNADVVCCGFERAGELAAKAKERVVLPHDYGAAFDHQRGLFAHGGTFALRRAVFEAIGGYAPGLTSGQHTELALRLLPHCAAEGWAIHNIPVPLIRYHLHAGARIRRNPAAIYQGTQYVLQQHGDQLRRDPKLYANYCAVGGANAARLGRYREARRLFLLAIATYPWHWRNYARLVVSLFPTLGFRVWAPPSGTVGPD